MLANGAWTCRALRSESLSSCSARQCLQRSTHADRGGDRSEERARVRTELGDAELQGVMSLSGHRTPDAARGYVKETDSQRLAAAKKRRAWVLELEHAKNESQNEPLIRESE